MNGGTTPTNPPHYLTTNPSGLVTTYYWGTGFSNCANNYYSDADTTNYDWTTPNLQQNYCDIVSYAGGQSAKVFAHSMGNLLLGGSCYYGRSATVGSLGSCCNARYYNLAGPLTGTGIADLGASVQSVLNIIGVKVLSTADLAFKTSFPGLRSGSNKGGLTNAIASHGMILGSMCGNAYIGDGSPTSMGVECTALKALGPSTADCLVDWQGCANYWTGSTWANWLGGSFSSNSGCRTYGDNMNHLDR